MTFTLAGPVPTRLVDLSGLILRDLDNLEQNDVLDCSSPIVHELSTPATVSLAGSDS